MAWSRRTVLVVAAVVAALGAAVWALGDPSPNPGGLGALPAPAGGPALPTLPADDGLSTPHGRSEQAGGDRSGCHALARRRRTAAGLRAVGASSLRSRGGRRRR